MCPISGLVQFLMIIIGILLVCQALVANSQKIIFAPENVTVNMYDMASIQYIIQDVPGDQPVNLQLISQDNNIAELIEIEIKYPDQKEGIFNISAQFLGKTAVVCRNKGNDRQIEGKLPVTVVRKKRVIDTIFTASVATLVSIIYINFGCALKWGDLRQNLKRPIGPVIGFIGQFIFMPLLSFGIGKLLFPSSPEMQLGMFFTGVSPAGGASNVWTVILDGNMDLSITMTTISTFAAFAMMPLWIFTLGKMIFDHANLAVPYSQISMYAIGLVVPLAIGYLLQRFAPRIAKFLAGIIKCFSSILILFIVIFAVVTNLYLFKLFSWQIVIAGMGLPYLGYFLGYLLAVALKQPEPDSLAIAIETGIQNTGIAIFLLRFTLPQPEGDLTTVVPVAVAIMTPLPLLCMYIYRKFRARSLRAQRLNSIDKAAKELATDDNCNNEIKGCKLSVIS